MRRFVHSACVSGDGGGRPRIGLPREVVRRNPVSPAIDGHGWALTSLARQAKNSDPGRSGIISFSVARPGPANGSGIPIGTQTAGWSGVRRSPARRGTQEAGGRGRIAGQGEWGADRRSRVETEGVSHDRGEKGRTEARRSTTSPSSCRRCGIRSAYRCRDSACPGRLPAHRGRRLRRSRECRGHAIPKSGGDVRDARPGGARAARSRSSGSSRAGCR